jgi:hypothetical protein
MPVHDSSRDAGPRQQPHRPERVQQAHRIDVLSVAPGAPVQAASRPAAVVGAVDPADQLTPPDVLTAPHERVDRLVLGAHPVGMREDDQPAPGHRAGERHRPGAGGDHRSARRRGEGDA